MKPQRLYIFDTTLRDGEQSPGASMTVEEKLSIAQMLDKMGVDIIEMGFPSASPADFEVAKRIGNVVKKATVCALARCQEKDISVAWDALSKIPNLRLHLFLSTSPLHMKHKLGMTPDEVLDAIAKNVAFAKTLFPEVEFSPEDATRTERNFLARCITVAVKNGARVINIPDTVGYSTPEDILSLFTFLNNLPQMKNCVLSTHCHDDLGLAVANSLAAVRGGARQVECTINGIGERAGNASLEEVVMACKVRKDTLPFETNIKTEMFGEASKLVAKITNFPVQYNKAIVGRNAFSHESGIHQDGMLKHKETYEIMRPEHVGASSSLTLGKLSGRHAFRKKVEALGYQVTEQELVKHFKKFKHLTAEKKHVYEDDLRNILEENDFEPSIHLKSLKITSGNLVPQSAFIILDIDGEEKRAEVQGNGPVDALFRGISQIVPHKASLLLYDVAAVTEGSGAKADVRVRLGADSTIFYGHSVHVDTMMASALAYISALDKVRNQSLITTKTYHVLSNLEDS